MNCNHSLVTSHRMQRDTARNGLVQKAIEIGAKYVFFIDDDTAPPPDAMGRLMYELDNSGDDIAAIGGVYVTKSDPAVPTILMDEGTGPHWKWRVGEIFPVFAIGTGCMMIRTEVFKKIPQPWFVDVKDIHHARSLGLLPDDADKQNVGEFAMTDDVYFCRKLREHGYKVLAHGGVLCTHYDQNGNGFILPPDSYPYLGRDRNPLPKPEFPVPPELKALRALYPYPDFKPNVDLALFPGSDWTDGRSQHLLKDVLIPKGAKCIVELGSWAGHGALRFAEMAPEAQIVCVDHFQGSREHWADESVSSLIPKLHRAFSANTWDQRHRIIPVKASTIVGMHEIKECGVKPDLIYVDASHEYEEVKNDIRAARELFPDAVLCGDDWNWDGVKKAVIDELGDAANFSGRTWWYDREKAAAALAESPKEELVAA